MKTILLLGGIIFLAVAQLRGQSPAQSVINTSGHAFQGAGYQVDWSIGETALITEMRSGSGQLIITNGFLQPQTPVPPYRGDQFSPHEIRVLPNATHDIVEVNLLTTQRGQASMELYNSNGKLLIRRTVAAAGFGQREYIDLSTYAAGTYMLHINLTPEQGFKRKTGTYKIVRL